MTCRTALSQKAACPLLRCSDIEILFQNFRTSKPMLFSDVAPYTKNFTPLQNFLQLRLPIANSIGEIAIAESIGDMLLGGPQALYSTAISVPTRR